MKIHKFDAQQICEGCGGLSQTPTSVRLAHRSTQALSFSLAEQIDLIRLWRLHGCFEHVPMHHNEDRFLVALSGRATLVKMS